MIIFLFYFLFLFFLRGYIRNRQEKMDIVFSILKKGILHSQTRFRLNLLNIYMQFVLF